MAFTDDFTRADSATVGNGWTETNAASFEILTNKLRATGTGSSYQNNIAYAPAAADFADGVAIVDLNFTGAPVPQLYARLNIGSQNGYLFYWSGGTLKLSTMTGGSLTDLATVAQALTAGVNYRLTFTLSGTNKTGVLRNLDTATDLQTLTDNVDATYTASGLVGVSIHTAGTIDYDNFSSTQAASGPSISDIDTDEIVEQSQTGVVITGATFEATQGTGTVKISPTDNIADAAVVTQTVTAWADTSISITADFTGTGIAEGGTGYVFVTNNTAQSNASGFVITRADLTLPVLTSPTGTATGTTTATGNVTTDEGNGTVYRYTSTSATPPSVANHKSGSGAAAAANQAVSGTGLQTMAAITGLTASTDYYNHYLQTDDAGNDSAQVSSALFTTSAAVGIVTDPIKNYSGTLQSSQSGYIANIYNVTTGALVVRLTGLSTDAGAQITLTDAAIITATTYRVDIDNGAGLYGNKNYTAS